MKYNFGFKKISERLTKMALTPFLFMSVFHLPGTVGAVQQSSLNRTGDQKFIFGNFKVDFYQHLSVAASNSLLLKDELDCPFECIAEARCYSFNVAAYPDPKGLYLCELLDTDKYRARDKLQANASFHHHSPWVSLP